MDGFEWRSVRCGDDLDKVFVYWVIFCNPALPFFDDDGEQGGGVDMWGDLGSFLNWLARLSAWRRPAARGEDRAGDDSDAAVRDWRASECWENLELGPRDQLLAGFGDDRGGPPDS